jgi:hypothetical protein
MSVEVPRSLAAMLALDPGAEVVTGAFYRQKRRVDALDIDAAILHCVDMR